MRFKKIKILLTLSLLIALTVLYYFIVYRKTTDEMSLLNESIEKINSEIEIENAKNEKLMSMSKEIEKGKCIDSKVYDFDMEKEELSYLSDVFSGLKIYNFSFDTPVTEDGVYVRRNVKISFTAGNYEIAKALLGKIIFSPYRTIVNDISISPVQGSKSINEQTCINDGGEVSVVVNVVFIELCLDNKNNGLIYKQRT